MNRSFYAFVEKTPSYETDSLHFRIVLPAHFHDQALDTIRLVLVSPQADTVLDTAVHDIFAGRGMVRFTTPPMPAMKPARPYTSSLIRLTRTPANRAASSLPPMA